MSYKEIHEVFIKLFPLYSGVRHAWYPAGKNTIRIKLMNDTNVVLAEFIFIYNSNRRWSFETLDNYKDR